MAKFSIEGKGNFNLVINELHKQIMATSMSVHLEDKESVRFNNFKTELRVYERYSFLGKNRVSLTLMLVEYENNLKLTLISSGGSQAIFFKINRFGESAFINKVIPLAKKLIK